MIATGGGVRPSSIKKRTDVNFGALTLDSYESNVTVVTSGTSGFLDGYLPYLLRRADQTLSAPFYAVLNRYGVARSEWRVLAVLAESGEVGVVDLANAALSPQPTVTHALRRLEDRGLVVRKHGPDDRRQRLVSITPNGTQLAATLTAEAKALEAEQLADASELTDLINRLRDLTSTLEATAQLRAATADRTG